MGNKRKAEKKRRERRTTIMVISILMFGLACSGWLTLWELRQAQKLVKVEGANVCMLDDLYASSGNHPSQIEDLTYYCCYENCAEHFAETGMSRFAQDPISGATVNKANAVYGRARNGKVFYFENEEDLAAYPP